MHLNHPRETNLLKAIAVFLVLLMFSGPAAIASGTGDTSSDSTQVDKNHPNLQPYETSYSIGHHLLALPSYMLHWVSRPIGWGVIYAETNFPHLFEGERGDYGIFPLFESGSKVKFAAGAFLFHQHLFRENHEARLQFLYGTDSYLDSSFEYRVPVSRRYNSSLSFLADYEKNPNQRFFIAENRQFYSAKDASFGIRYNSSLSSVVRMQNSIQYRNNTVRSSSSEIIDEEILLFPDEFKGNYELLTIGSSFAFDFRRGSSRKVGGSQFIAGADWINSLKNSTSYLQYHLEYHQFVPIPFLPESRRLGLKTKINKAEQLSGSEIPFFDLPTLGGSRNLRGFRNHRFRDEGFWIVTAEYRYPMWDVLDVTLFMDQGQVFTDFSDIALDKFESSYGFGVHLLSSKGLAFRAELAFSNEDTRYILTISPNF